MHQIRFAVSSSSLQASSAIVAKAAPPTNMRGDRRQTERIKFYSSRGACFRATKRPIIREETVFRGIVYAMESESSEPVPGIVAITVLAVTVTPGIREKTEINEFILFLETASASHAAVRHVRARGRHRERHHAGNGTPFESAPFASFTDPEHFIIFGKPLIGRIKTLLLIFLRPLDGASFFACFLAFGAAFLSFDAPDLGFVDISFAGSGMNLRRTHSGKDDKGSGNEEDEQDGRRFQHGKTPIKFISVLDYIVFKVIYTSFMKSQSHFISFLKFFSISFEKKPIRFVLFGKRREAAVAVLHSFPVSS
jgi:hypothetical protein